MITEFGKTLRFYRLEHGILLKDMAMALDVPSSYLSAIEMGHKSVTKDIVEKILNKYTFTQEEKKQLEKSVEESVLSIKIDLRDINSKKRTAALSFARKFVNLDSNQVDKILSFLNDEDDT